MNIFELYKKSFTAVVKNPPITMILVLFLIAFSLLAKDFSLASAIPSSLKTIAIYLLSVSFISGWFYLIKNTDLNTTKEEKSSYALFLEGIGKNIIPFSIGSIFYLLLAIFVAIITIKFCHQTFGSLEFLLKDFATIAQDDASMMKFFSNLKPNEEYIVSAWFLTFAVVSLIFNFVLLFYFPALTCQEKKNNFLKPLIAFKNALCFLFKNFFVALFMYSTIYFLYMALNIIRVFTSANFVLSILCLLAYIYFISFAIMLIFSYYGQKNNCNNGCDSIGQDENINRISEEN